MISSYNDSNNAPIHRRRTQGTRPLPASSSGQHPHLIDNSYFECFTHINK